MTRHNTSTIGFTLIEILIVVVIIGILAVGLIAALDPFEQIRKAQDTTLQATARQVYYPS